MTITPSTAPTSGEQTEELVMTWLDHLREFRNRFVKASLAVLVGLMLGFFLVQYNNYALINFVVAHFTTSGVHLQAIAVGEKFTNAIQIALGMGIAFAMPVIVYQLLAFIVPGLTKRERRIIYLVLPFIVGCFVAGLIFGWLVTVPAATQFLLTFGPATIQATPTFEQFADFLVHLMLINGIVFELPVLVYAVIWLGVVERKTLTRFRRYAILIITIIAAVITPTGDPVNLGLVAIPMYLLYELGLILALVAPRHKSTPTI